MGLAVIRAIYEDNDLELAGAVDRNNINEDIGSIAGIGNISVNVCSSIEELPKTDVIVDFTIPDSVKKNIIKSLELGINCVVGTTGLQEADLKEIEIKAKETNRNVFIAPNFAIGAVLMMEMSKKVSKFMDNVEIIEMHHDNKLDAPSGTAIKTANDMDSKSATIKGESELAGARGSLVNNIRIHSIRLPGYVAHQEVIFGAKGQTLTIRHDSIDRVSFMPGVVTAIKAVSKLNGLTVGLEKILDI